MNGTVTVIEGDTNTTTTLPAGICPVSIAVNPVSNTIYVANLGKVCLINNSCNNAGSVTGQPTPPPNWNFLRRTCRILAACGGGSGPPPPQTYTVTVAAASSVTEQYTIQRSRKPLSRWRNVVGTLRFSAEESLVQIRPAQPKLLRFQLLPQTLQPSEFGSPHMPSDAPSVATRKSRPPRRIRNLRSEPRFAALNHRKAGFSGLNIPVGLSFQIQAWTNH